MKPTTIIKLTPMGRKPGAPAISIYSPLIVAHYEGSYSDAIAVYDALGGHLPLEPAQLRVIEVVQAELLLNGNHMASKLVKAPPPRPESRPFSQLAA